MVTSEVFVSAAYNVLLDWDPETAVRHRSTMIVAGRSPPRLAEVAATSAVLDASRARLLTACMQHTAWLVCDLRTLARH